MENGSILDCSKIADDSYRWADIEEFAEKCGKQLTRIGFVYLENHGIDLEKVEKLQALSKSFFELPMELKNKYHKKDVTKSYHGYLSPGEEVLDRQNPCIELKEMLDVFNNEVLDASNFPVEISEFKETLLNFKSECNQFIKRLLKSLAIYLKLEDPEHFLKYHQNLDNVTIKSQSLIRLMYYAPVQMDIPARDMIRCGQHKDIGTMALIFQDAVGGLEVKTESLEWINATPIKGTIVVTTGRILELWTNAQIIAAPHRVRMMTKDEAHDNNARSRLSIIVATRPDSNIFTSTLSSQINFSSIKLQDYSGGVNLTANYLSRVEQSDTF